MTLICQLPNEYLLNNPLIAARLHRRLEKNIFIHARHCLLHFDLLVSNDFFNLAKSEAEPLTRYIPTSDIPRFSTSLIQALIINGMSRFSRL